MNYQKHQRLIWVPHHNYEKPEHVWVVDLRERGRSAKLSNGWVVDQDGIAEGTSRQPGGSVREPNDGEVSLFDDWYSEVMLVSVHGGLAPQDYVWSFENADTVWRSKFDAGMDSVDASVYVFASH